MQIPVISGVIDRRILVNFRIDGDVMARVLPSPFRPKLVDGYAIGGICLIRLKHTRPRFSPLPWGARSENAAHRFAVEWESGGELREGVYIPRRDTNSRLSTMVGGRVFPGVHYHASFAVREENDYFSVTVKGGDDKSDDDDTFVHVSGRVVQELPCTSVFSTLAEASTFFERGSLGYSDTRNSNAGMSEQFDGLELRCKDWHADPLEIEDVKSSYFEDEARWPKGSVEFDCALLMRNIEHEWHSRELLHSAPAEHGGVHI